MRTITLIISLFLCLWHNALYADDLFASQKAYLAKYLKYTYWVEHLPAQPQDDFLQFIEPKSPLTQKLREKWLYLLAEKQDWSRFDLYYRTTDNIGLQCYQQWARYKLDQKHLAVQDAFNLWLSPQTQSSAVCQRLFTYLQQEHAFSITQMEQKAAQALAQNQSANAYELLLRMGPNYTQALKTLVDIKQNPRHISQIQPGPLSGAILLYGLNMMLERNLDSTISLWHEPRLHALLSPKQNQQFLAHVALYKIIRNQKDASQWLDQVQPSDRDARLKDWGIRYALLQENWHEIVHLTECETYEQAEPFQVYWRARALAKLQQTTQAQTLYRMLANKRHYYGFLASLALHQSFQFESDLTPVEPGLLTVYKPITDQIAEYRRTKQHYLAAHLLNEFSMELSKPEKTALVYWVAHDLHWPGKAIYLSTQDEELKNQLNVRFPLTYQHAIQTLANQYHISPALIYATIRQESTFLDDIKSEAGAYGLMQILPRTAKITAKQAKIAYSDSKELFHPEKNLHIGVAYLRTLYQQFHAHPILVMAAYNAGPRQVQHWRHHHSPKEMDIWIETLPWQETRNYLKNVIAFYAVYQYRMHQKPNLSSFLQPL